VAKGKKYGGRQKGTPNKREAYSVQKRLEEMGFDLIGEILNEIAEMEDPMDRAQCYLRLLEYCDAKRKAIEISGELNANQMEIERIKAMPMNELMEKVKTLLPEES